MDDVGLFMDASFMPKQKDNITLTFNKPVLDIAITGNYCLILCEGILQIYTICNYILIKLIQKNASLFSK